MITEVQYVDDPQNVTQKSQNPEVLYQGVVLGGFKSGQLISNLRLSSFLQGEKTLRPTSKSLTDDPLSTHDGDVVLVEFIQGHQGYPAIIAIANAVNAANGTKKADGPRSIEEYNGIRQEINNKGEFIFTQKLGSLNPQNVFTSGTQSQITDEFRINEKFIRTFKSGLVITNDGKNDLFSVKLKNGIQVSFDGLQDQILLKTKGTAELNLKAGKVAIGASGVELLQKISDSLDKIITWANSVGAVHTHIGNLGYPTAPPTEAAGYTQLGSDLTTIKSAIDGIKGSL